LIPPFALFTLTTFFEGKLEGHLGATFCNILFFASIAYIVIGFLLIAWRRNTPPKHEHCYVAVAAWFLFWVALARDAVRYDFFIGVPIAFFAATLIQFLSDALSTKLNARRVPRQLLKAGITVASLIVLMCWTPAGAHAKRTLFAARHMRQAMPGHTKIEKTFRWMKAQLPGPAVVAASWSYGSQLNVLGGVRTVTDQDHFIQHWIHLYYRHVYCAQSDAEALEFLKTHRATHLMLTAEDVLKFAPRHSSLGSDADSDRQFQLIPLQMRTYEGGRPALVPAARNTPFTHINIAQGSERDTPFTTVAKLKNGNTVEMSYVAFIGKTRIHSQNQIELKTGGIVLFLSEQQQLQNGYYIPQIGWNSLAVRLFFRGESPSVFAPVYPANSNVTAEVKVWEIRYPPEITTHPKFLATDPGR